MLYSASAQTCRTPPREAAAAMQRTKHQTEVLSSASVEESLTPARESAGAMRTTDHQAEVLYSAFVQICLTPLRETARAMQTRSTGWRRYPQLPRKDATPPLGEVTGMRPSSTRSTCDAHRHTNRSCHSLRDNKGASKLWLL